MSPKVRFQKKSSKSLDKTFGVVYICAGERMFIISRFYRP